MAERGTLHKPWLVAVWPGMGNVAISAGYYLLAKLGMHLVAEFSPRELFEVEHVEVKDGLIQLGRLPRSRFFAWKDPAGQHDIVVFIGEAQPPIGKFAFCNRFVEFARQLGVERVFTFAAMATQMHPEHDSRVFAAATDEEGLAELRQQELEVLNDGNIGGMNGVMLGIAAEKKLRGACLLGEMPHIFAQFPFPKASLAVLEVFTKIAGITVDFTELSEQAKAVEQKLGELLAQVETEMEQQRESTEEDEFSRELPEQERLSKEDEQFIERLFEQAKQDRSKAYELKRDRLLDGAKIHLVNSDPPYNVKVEPRSNNAIAAGLSSFPGTTHHQGLDLARHPGKSKPTQKKLRAKDRPLANDFVTDAAFDELLDAWFGNMARVLQPGRGFYIWGGYANLGNYPPYLKKHELYFSQGIVWDKQHPVLTRKDRMGSRVERVGFAWERGKVRKP